MEESPPITDDPDTIGRGKFAIVRRTFESNAFKLVKIGNDKFFYFSKQKICADSLIGQKFGQTFELNSERNLIRVDLSNYLTNTKNSEESDVSKDNRFIVDDNKSQRLTRNDIEKMKKETSGKEVIRILVENSSTFDEKNQFAQQKYLNKKQQKYLNLFTVLKPNIKYLMEMYYSQGPAKNNYLRIDSLSQMLTLTNIMSGGRYIVVDSNLGILSAALIERTAGKGAIIQVYTEDNPNSSNRQAVYALNYPEEVVENCLFTVNINQVAELLSESADSQNGNSESLMTSEEDGDKVLTKKEKRINETNAAKRILRTKNLDGLLILTKNYDPSTIVNILIEFIDISRPFVVFSPSIDPLKTCYTSLKSCCINLKISETWLRKYQVLAERTRPEMMMNAHSGFVLSGIKVQM